MSRIERGPWRVRLVGLLASFALGASGLVALAANPPSAAAAGAHVFLVGDSVMAGLRFSPSALASLDTAFDVTLDAKVCRALLEPSCSTKYDGQPPAALTVLRANRGNLGDVVVVMAGYNDGGIGPKVDAVMGELESQHVPHVLWLTYRNLTGRYTASNATLEAEAASHPTLTIADWNAYSAGHGDWFAGDGLHLTGAGADALAGFLEANITTLLDAPPPRCSGGTQGTPTALPTVAPIQTAAPAGYEPVQPFRAIDTRAAQPLGAGRAMVVDVAAAPAGADATLVNLTAVDACGPGFLTAYPCAGAVPLASNLNTARHQTVANTAAVLLGPDHRLCVYASVTTDVIVDVSGWFVPGNGWLYQPVTPDRLVDTRGGGGADLPVTGAIAAGGTLAIPVTAWPGSPDAPTAALVNVTAVDAAAPGFLTVAGCGAPASVSTVNYAPGAPTANMAAPAISAAGTICVTSSAATDVVVDLEGWFGPTGSLFSARTPQRLLDSRTTAPIGPGAGATIGVPGAIGALVNVTAVDAPQAGYLTAAPCGSASPVSTVNYTSGEVVPGLAAVGAPGQAICVSALTATDVVVDLFGTFG